MMACSIITLFSKVSLTPVTLKYLNLLLMCSQPKGESREKGISFDYTLQKKKKKKNNCHCNHSIY